MYLTYSPYVILSEQWGHLTKLKSSDNSAVFLQSGQIIFILYGCLGNVINDLILAKIGILDV